jgi:hypothetical protein
VKQITQETYDKILKYKLNPQSILDKAERVKIKSIAQTFDLEGKEDSAQWPNGYRLFKVQFQQTKRIGLYSQPMPGNFTYL